MSDYFTKVNKIKNKTISGETEKELFRRIEIMNLIKAYKREQINPKAMRLTFRLPSLNKSNSKRNIKIKKIDKKNSFSTTHRTKFIDEKVNFNDLTSRYNINQKNNQNLKNIDKILKKMNLIKKSYKNKNNANYHNSLSKLSYYSNFKSEKNTTYSNRGKIYKIKNFENSKMMIDDFYKINNNYFFLKKNYYIKKNNMNKDIFNLLIDTHNFNLTNVISPVNHKK